MKKNKKLVMLLILILNFNFIFLNFFNVSRLREENDKENNELLLVSSNSIEYEWDVTWGEVDDDRCMDLAIDSSNNIYLSGYTGEFNTGNIMDWRSNISLVKFNSSSNYQWNREWDKSEMDSSFGLALDSLENIYLSGTTWNWTGPGDGAGDMCVIKFNSSGDYQWESIWDGGFNEGTSGIVVDSSGNIYLAGYTDNIAGGYDIILVKFDSSGQYQWNRVWDGGNWDDLWAIKMDSAENIYLTGYTENIAGNEDIYLVKYDSSGNFQWSRTWGGNNYEVGHGLAVDSVDNIYIVGYTFSFGARQSDMVLIKYDSSGVLHWNKTWGGNNDEVGHDLAVDSSDNVYLTGYTSSFGAGGVDIALLKYDSSGVKQWNYTWGGSNDERAWAITLDPAENIYIAGYTNNTIGGDTDMLLVKFKENIININTPESKTYAEPMSGYYPGTYSFDDAPDGQIAPGWTDTDKDAEIIAEMDNHKKVYELIDNSPTNGGDTFQDWDAVQDHGTVESWMRFTNNVQSSDFRIHYDTDSLCILGVGDGSFRYTDNTGTHNISGAPTPQINTWYHIKFDFRGSYGSTYEGLTSQYTYMIAIDGVSFGPYNFTANNDPNRFRVHTGIASDNVILYWDAVGYSWDPNYNIGDNLNEGLLLSFIPDDLDWMAFSLDGQPNRTILGNTTIPFPDDEDHTIQVFGNNTLGVIYQSDILYFSVDTTAPISNIWFIPHEGVNKVNISTDFTLTADDGIGSGVSRIMYRINDSMWFEFSNTFNLSSYDYGYYLISYYAIDNVDNTEEVKTLLVELIKIPSEPSKPEITGYDLILLIGILSIVSILLTKRFLMKKN